MQGGPQEGRRNHMVGGGENTSRDLYRGGLQEGGRNHVFGGGENTSMGLYRGGGPEGHRRGRRKQEREKEPRAKGRRNHVVGEIRICGTFGVRTVEPID
jgi:hypothetical protein